jgi:MscS family membrane protein
VGDAIEIEKISDWGIVTQIGLRTTHIQTYDNRVVIIPNSIIGKNLVINYTYPDPRYRLETRVWVAYGTNIKAARELITETILGVEGVLPEEAVKVLCHEMGESAMVLRVWWWIADYDETAFVRDRVIEAVQLALEENGFSIAHPTRDLNLRVTPETVSQLSQAFGNQAEGSASNQADI